MNWRPSKVFYGWWIVGACVLIGLYISGAVFYGFTAIFEPIVNDLGWSYTQVSLAASLRGLEMGLLAPVFGILADRWGPRRLIFSAGILTAIGFFFLGRTTSLGMFYAGFLLISIGMSGCTMTVLMTAVAYWFRRKVGTASGIAMCGFGLGGLMVPVIAELIEKYEWRTTVTILAVGILVWVLPLSLVFRHKPEQYGYLPDGRVEDSVTLDNSPSLSHDVDVNVNLKQALRGNIFWILALAFTCQILLVNAVVTHAMPYLSSVGVTRSMSSLVATAIPLVSIGGRLGLGWLGDKINRRLLLVGALAMISLGVLCFGYAPIAGFWLLVPFLVLFGFGYGGCNALRPSLTREYFGRTNFGSVFGTLMGINMLGAIIGPTLAGWVYDVWGSYQGIWLVLAVLPIAVLVAVLTIPVSRNTAELADKV
ncbi:MFS transporter [Chloroflexota bacterium]